MTINQDKLEILEKLRSYQEDDKHVLVYIVNENIQREENLKDSYFIGKGDQLVSSLIDAKHFDTECLAKEEVNKKNDDSLIIAPLSLFVDNEIAALLGVKLIA